MVTCVEREEAGLSLPPPRGRPVAGLSAEEDGIPR